VSLLLTSMVMVLGQLATDCMPANLPHKDRNLNESPQLTRQLLLAGLNPHPMAVVTSKATKFTSTMVLTVNSHKQMIMAL